jgi:hypothetical protein
VFAENDPNAATTFVGHASLKVSLARRRGSLAGVREQVDVLTGPMSRQSTDDIALCSDLRAVALMNLGIVEASSLATPDAERHLLEGAGGQPGAGAAREAARPRATVPQRPSEGRDGPSGSSAVNHRRA